VRSTVEGVRVVEVHQAITELVPRDQLQAFRRELETTELVCIVCGEEEPAGSSEAVTLQLLVDPDSETSALHAAHRRCAPSAVHSQPGLAAVLDDDGSSADVRWYPMQLPGGELVVVWESSIQLVAWDSNTEPATISIATLLRDGFGLVTLASSPAEAFSDLPAAPGWSASLDETDLLVIRTPTRETALECTLGLAVPDELRAAFHAARELIALTGSGLQVDSDDRLGGLLEAAVAGTLLGARVPLTIGPPGG